MAQSSVTISGIFKASLESVKIGSPTAARSLAGTNTSESRVSDDSSRIIFNVKEDLGGGLAAIGQIDVRFNISSGAAGSTGASGNTHVGLMSKSLGRFIVGRQDIHYYNRESDLTNLAGDLRADSISLISSAGAGTQSIAVTSRTGQVMQYTSPNFGGFTISAAYATNGPNGAQADLASATRKGNSWNLNPNFKGSNFQVGWSYFRGKNDGGGATLATGDQKSNRLYGSFNVAGFKLGLAWDKSTITATTGIGDLSERTAWSFPVSYNMGAHGFHAHYTKARDDKKTVAQDGAKMFAMSYQYSLSKRTSVGVTYAKITNDTGAAYNFFTNSSLGNSAMGIAGGEDPRLLAATLRHAF
jgi:predicted porin